MGVYIKGVEMPKEGRLTLQISANGAVYVVNSCSITAETYTTDAAPVPPHGDLIDRNDIKDSVSWCTSVKHALTECDRAPTIIPAEEGE